MCQAETLKNVGIGMAPRKVNSTIAHQKAKSKNDFKKYVY